MTEDWNWKLILASGALERPINQGHTVLRKRLAVYEFRNSSKGAVQVWSGVT